MTVKSKQQIRRILVAPDKFKGSLSSDEAAEVIRKAILSIYPETEVLILPMADGGEGSLELFLRSTNGQRLSAPVKDPLGRTILSEFGFDHTGNTAFIEMARASGLSLLKAEDQNPLQTSSWGTGDLLLEAIKNKPGRIFFGLGGSATNDGGLGMASALGYRFLNRKGQIIRPVGAHLMKIARIVAPEKDPVPKDLKIVAGCDVSIPLYGSQGAAQVFARQKGAGDKEIGLLDFGLKNLARMVEKWLEKDLAFYPGAGAAGGLGYGLMVFAGATLQSGFEIMAELTGLRETLKKCQLVITGEGKMDEQTLHGKTVAGICQMAHEEEVPVIAVSGWCPSPEKIQKVLELKQIISLAGKPEEIGETMIHAKEILYRKVRENLHI